MTLVNNQRLTLATTGYKYHFPGIGIRWNFRSLTPPGACHASLRRALEHNRKRRSGAYARCSTHFRCDGWRGSGMGATSINFLWLE
ncbi:unnamed protein product [Arctia plantaginis]|uniref:Uncharacterized protein n=1 Tax=Arctia plantaginis TaxID=874455 RepID=A0A8S0Z9T0_ARCPL|nr:unnamed protein product [Arctia plantaginis]